MGLNLHNAQQRSQVTYRSPSPRQLGYGKAARERNSRWELKRQKRHHGRPPVEGGFLTGTRCRIFRNHGLSMNSNGTYSNRFQTTICGQQRPTAAQASNQQQTQYSGLGQTVNTKCWVSLESSVEPLPPKFFRKNHPSGHRSGDKNRSEQSDSIAEKKVFNWAKKWLRQLLKIDAIQGFLKILGI